MIKLGHSLNYLLSNNVVSGFFLVDISKILFTSATNCVSKLVHAYDI